MNEEFEEYVTFTVNNKAGQEVEMAVIDEFDFEHKHYIVGALIEGDAIHEDGLYIYRAKVMADDFTVEKITNPTDYQKVAKAYMELDDN